MERIPQPIMDKRGEPHMRRFQEQRWVLDNLVRANGIDWDQPRSIYISAPCGPEGGADIAGVRERVKKMADIAPAFEAVARRREAKAKAAEEAGSQVTARDNYFMAAVYWGQALSRPGTSTASPSRSRRMSSRLPRRSSEASRSAGSPCW